VGWGGLAAIEEELGAERDGGAKATAERAGGGACDGHPSMVLAAAGTAESWWIDRFRLPLMVMQLHIDLVRCFFWGGGGIFD
jgi:hypothetical protein